MVALVCVGALSLSATACAPTDAKPTPTPTKTAIFASEDEALQAAVDVYQQYSAVVDKITAEGDAHMAELDGLVTRSYLNEYMDTESFEDRGWHTTGDSTFRNSEIVELAQTKNSATIQIALCRDLSKVKILDANGDDISDETRQRAEIPYTLRFVWDAAKSRLKLSDSGTWDDDSIC
ncbi:hypothetical protein [Paramicrobacterium fandaimingii]|uniref:hypothetical protein n=1 Tax=Paramicrobacterium fandaimingii TaxID=2708079 RepID=UPI001421EE08|nr:hypothetical protein [Microbacterium fandaimingii]